MSEEKMIDGRGAGLGLRGTGGTEGWRGAAPPASPPTRRQVVVVVVGSSAAPARLGGVDFSINSFLAGRFGLTFLYK